jgi:hypothetical protein
MPRVSDKPAFQSLFETFGVEFAARSGADVRALECPWCGGAKFYVNTTTGQYKCHNENSCGEQGNAFTFIRWLYREILDRTTDAHYQQLKAKRALPLQTLKHYGLAWDEGQGCWLVPYMSPAGEVMNLLRYWPGDGRKWVLPGMGQYLFGVDQLSDDPARTLFLCESAFDTMALHHHFCTHKSRGRYDLLAVPGALIFFPPWLDFLKDRDVRLCFDNDKAGREGQDKVVKLVREHKTPCKLSALDWPAGRPEGYDIADAVRDGEHLAEFTRRHCKRVGGGTKELHFVRGDEIVAGKSEWFWKLRIPFGTLTSFSGDMGTMKSTIACDLAARATAGLTMPLCENDEPLPPFPVLVFTSEDSAEQVRDLVALYGGDLKRLFVHDVAATDEPLDLLNFLEEMEDRINILGARLVVIDALNSFVGGDISSDAKARRTLSGKLHALARRTGACILGLRNWGRQDTGKASNNALGAVSLGHVARCTINTRRLKRSNPKDPKEPPQFRLEFEKVSGCAPPKPIRYMVQDCSTCDADAHLRKILWGKSIPQVKGERKSTPEELAAAKASLARMKERAAGLAGRAAAPEAPQAPGRKKVAQNGSKTDAPMFSVGDPEANGAASHAH